MNKFKVTAIVVIVLAVLIAPILIYRHAKYSSIHTETFTVTRLPDRSMEYSANGTKNTYANLVYTNKGIYQNTDSWFPLKTRSSDVFNQLEVGETYTCEVAGWRYGFISTYKNIITCDGFKYE